MSKKNKEPERLNRIKEVLEKLDMDQQTLSIKAEMGYASINAYYHGKKEPSLKSLQTIAKALKVKGGDLLNF